MESNTIDEPLMYQRAPSSGGSVGNVDRYDDALGSVTSAKRISANSLIDSIFTDGEGEPGSPTSASTDSGDEADAAAGAKLPRQGVETKVTTFVLAAILFFNAGGGPFGVEPSLKAAGNLYALIGFAVMPVIWALPEAVMTYELSYLYPCASGGVRWTEEAFGEGWGLLVGYLGWISGVTNSACRPVLFLSYVENQFFPNDEDIDHNALVHFGILTGITLLLAFVNYRGLDFVGKTLVLIFLVTVTPFVLLVIIGFPKVDPSKWLQTPTGEVEVFNDDTLAGSGWFPEANLAGIAFRPFINNLYWNFNGFDQGGHYSTVATKKTLRDGIIGSLLLVSSSYMLPILVCTGATDIEQDEWRAGSFAVAGTEIAGAWLGNWIVVAAGVTLLAQFFSGMSADSLQILGMADRGQLPSILGHRNAYDAPTYGLLLSVVVILSLLPLPFGIIVELSNFAFCLSVALEFLAFAQLRIRKGDGSVCRKTMYAFMLVPPMLINIIVIMLASWATYIFGACLTFIGVLLILTKRMCSGSGCCSSYCNRDV